MQRRSKGRWRYGWIGLGLLGVLTLVGFVFPHVSRFASRRQRPSLENLSTAVVRRGDIWESVTAGGTVSSANQTNIECQLQSLSAGVNGQRLTTNGASTIITLVPAGTRVKKDQVLCELDSSEYVELVRQQEMTVERSKADHVQAKLDHEVALMAIEQFKSGLLHQTRKELDGKIALAKSDMERTSDRLRWSERMYAKGYASLGQVSNDRVSLQRLVFNLEQSQLASNLFHRYEVPGTIRQLENHSLATKANLQHQSDRLDRNINRLALFKRQVENCTIRAPHDGFLIYANNRNRNIVIEEGMAVYQNQLLFYLPDLAKMEVTALLHESVVQRVQDGMRAKIRIESLPNDTIEGEVVSIASLPTRDWFSEVTYYVGQVKLDSVPRGMLPGMTAQVEITTEHRPDVLTIPIQAMTVEDGLEVCYVSDGAELERREVKLGPSSNDRLEVVEGLEEGEQVVLDPSSIDAEILAELAPPSDPPAVDESEPLEISAAASPATR